MLFMSQRETARSRAHGRLFRSKPVVVLTLSAILLVPVFVSAGTVTPAQEKFVKHYAKQKNIPQAEDMLVNTDPEPKLGRGFVSLFNGRDLNGWSAKGGECLFEAQDGIIVGTCKPGSPSTYLCTDKNDYTDFVFTCDMKWIENGNTGVMIRAHVVKKGEKETVTGPQAEMEGFDDRQRCWSGGIYGQSCGGWYYPLWLDAHKEARAALKKDAWNRLTIKAKGNTIKTWLNGVPAAHWKDYGSYPKGFFGLQIHKGKKGKVLWRNLRVKELE